MLINLGGVVMSKQLKLFISIILFMISHSVYASVDSQIKELTKSLTESYVNSKERFLIKKNLGITDFKNNTKTAENHKVGQMVSALFVENFRKTTIFDVIDRSSLETILKEQELSLTGIVEDSSALEPGNLKAIEVMVFGEINEDSENFIVSARLVDTETGSVAAAKKINIEKSLIAEESEKYQRASFQSKYGLAIKPIIKGYIPVKDPSAILGIWGVDIHYKWNSYLNIGFGYVGMDSGGITHLDDEKISVTDGNSIQHSNITRYYQFSGSGVRLSGILTLPVSARFNFLAGGSFYLLLDTNLYQDLPEFPVWDFNATTGTPEIVNKRVLVNGYSYEPQFITDIFLGIEFLISKRLSINFKGGFFYFPRYTPKHFESSGNLQSNSIESDADIDRNGTFAEYQNFNFSRTYRDGNRVSVELSGISISLGFGVHF